MSAAQEAWLPAASAALLAWSIRPESSPPVKSGTIASARVIAVPDQPGSFGSLPTKSGKENSFRFSFRANDSAGESVRM